MKTTTRYAITVICEDRIGLVGRFTGAITELGGNIEVLDQTVRLGYFVITLMATFESGASADAVREGLTRIGETGSMAVSVLPRRDSTIAPAGEGDPYVLAMRGLDVPGNFSQVTTCLAKHHINVETMTCQTEGDRFTIIGEITVPETVDPRSVKAQLSELLADRKVTVNLMHADIFDATNKIPMPERKIAS